MSSTNVLRRLLAEPGILCAPAVYDCIGAKLAQEAGFRFAFTSGFGIAASMLGTPDIGLLTATEVVQRATHIARSVDIPVVADIDTGYGDALNVVRTVEELVTAGLAGVILEDQEWPKRCGHLEGTQIIPATEHVAKIRAAVKARKESGLVVIARTDARAVAGLDEAIARARAYAEAGADVLFVEAPQSAEELQRIASELSGHYLLANIIEGGKTPNLSAQQLEAMGFKICVFALSALFAATAGTERAMKHLAAEGTTAGLTSAVTFDRFLDLVGLDYYQTLEREVRGQSAGVSRTSATGCRRADGK